MTSSLIDMPVPAEPAPQQVKYRDQTYDIPVNFRDPATGELNLGALLKSHHDLRRRLSQRPAAPEHYDLALPGELAELFCRCEAEATDPERYRETQMQALEQALGDGAPHVCKEVGQWFGALLGEDFSRDPDLLAAAETLAADARGVLLLKALRDRLGERGVPGPRGEAGAPADEAALRRLQASQAYLDSRHPDHHAVSQRVRQGWRALVENGR